MIKKIKQSLAALTMGAMLFVPALVPAAVYAQGGGEPNINDNLCSGANLKVDSATGCETGSATTRVNDIIATVINILSIVVGVVAVIMIIIGGLKYITSGGDSGNVTGAKNTILYAVIGLVVVALAQIVVKFVLNRATGTAAG